MALAYEVGTRAWQPDTNEGWVASVVERKSVEGDQVKLIFKLENGEVCNQRSSSNIITADGIIDTRAGHKAFYSSE